MPNYLKHMMHASQPEEQVKVEAGILHNYLWKLTLLDYWAVTEMCKFKHSDPTTRMFTSAFVSLHTLHYCRRSGSHCMHGYATRKADGIGGALL